MEIKNVGYVSNILENGNMMKILHKISECETKIIFTRIKRVHNIATVQDKYLDIRYFQVILFLKKKFGFSKRKKKMSTKIDNFRIAITTDSSASIF